MSSPSIAEQAAAAVGLAAEQPHAARKLAEVARGRAVSSGLEAEEAVALRALGLAARTLDEITTATSFLTRAVETASRAGDRDIEAECRVSLSSALVLSGRSAAALEALSGTSPGPEVAVLVALQRAAILTMLGRYDEARGHYDPIVRSLRRSGDALLESRALTNRGLLHVYTGRFHLADNDLARAEQLAAGLGHLVEAAGHCHNRGFAAARRGDLPAALALFDRAERRYVEAGVPLGARALEPAEVLLAAGLIGDARRLLERAVTTMRSSGDRFGLAEGLVLLADTTHLAGDFDASETAAGEAAGLFAEQGRTGADAVARAAISRAALGRAESVGAAPGPPGARLGSVGTGVVPVEVAAAASAAAHDLDVIGLTSRALGAHAVAGQLWMIVETAVVDGPNVDGAGRADGPNVDGAGRADGANVDGAGHGAGANVDGAGRADGANVDGAGHGAGEAVGGAEPVVGGHGDGRAVTELARAASGRRRGLAADRAVAWDAEARRRLAIGDHHGALTALEAAVAAVDAQQAGLAATELRAHISRHAHRSAALGLRLALESGRPRQILGWMERRRANSLRSWPVQPPPDPALADDLAELRRLSAELAAAATTGADPRPTARRAAELERAVRERTWRRRADRPTRRPATIRSAEELQAALGGQALVELADSGGELHAVVLAGGRCSHRRLGATAAALAELEHLRFALRRATYGMDRESGAATALDDAADRFDRLLVAPIRSLVGDRAVNVVPTGALHAVPWSTLPSLAGRPVSVSPSAHTWLRASATPPPTGPMLAVAGPGLPAAHAEAGAVRRLYPAARLLRGRRATTGAVLAGLTGAAVAHVAAHAELNADNGLWSALQLSDGPLTVYELEGLSRAPGLVILSACQSGLSTVRSGDELLGLVASLLALGARTIIASVLPVDDHATLALMVALHARLVAGDPPATALAGAQAASTDTVVAASFLCYGAP